MQLYILLYCRRYSYLALFGRAIKQRLRRKCTLDFSSLYIHLMDLLNPDKCWMGIWGPTRLLRFHFPRCLDVLRFYSIFFSSPAPCRTALARIFFLGFCSFEAVPDLFILCCLSVMTAASYQLKRACVSFFQHFFFFFLFYDKAVLKGSGEREGEGNISLCVHFLKRWKMCCFVLCHT